MPAPTWSQANQHPERLRDVTPPCARARAHPATADFAPKMVAALAVWLPICASKLPTLPWLAQRNCTLEAVDCSTNCAPNADSNGRSLQCNHCRCRMCDFCVAELGDPKRPHRPQAYHATLAHKTTSWHEGKQQRRGKGQQQQRRNATAPDAAWAAGHEMWDTMGTRIGWAIIVASLLILAMLAVLCATARSNQLTQGSLPTCPSPSPCASVPQPLPPSSKLSCATQASVSQLLSGRTSRPEGGTARPAHQKCRLELRFAIHPSSGRRRALYGTGSKIVSRSNSYRCSQFFFAHSVDVR